MSRPFYKKKIIVSGDTYCIDAKADSIILYDSLFVVEHLRMTMKKKIKTCQQHHIGGIAHYLSG